MWLLSRQTLGNYLIRFWWLKRWLLCEGTRQISSSIIKWGSRMLSQNVDMVWCSTKTSLFWPVLRSCTVKHGRFYFDQLQSKQSPLVTSRKFITEHWRHSNRSFWGFILLPRNNTRPKLSSASHRHTFTASSQRSPIYILLPLHFCRSKLNSCAIMIIK